MCIRDRSTADEKTIREILATSAEETPSAQVRQAWQILSEPLIEFATRVAPKAPAFIGNVLELSTLPPPQFHSLPEAGEQKPEPVQYNEGFNELQRFCCSLIEQMHGLERRSEELENRNRRSITISKPNDEIVTLKRENEELRQRLEELSRLINTEDVAQPEEQLKVLEKKDISPLSDIVELSSEVNQIVKQEDPNVARDQEEYKQEFPELEK
eukprot:TRINITY_DN10241_c0_g1_i2.p1 TRINITY_DN10241_c0_g1~~TRINITY_DN10241_c0_g1_i2.p1  ORF type:complete len:233 (+),score=60.33 TRINITY_DN10241_c0_g1_i2:61-699(+)